MIARLSGSVVERTTTGVVVDVHGVGYLVHITPGTDVPPRGEPLTLHTSLQVREESMTLYGFGSEPELRLFELLLTAAGVGPKLALAALATHRPEVLRTALAGEDATTLTAIPGVGPKLAKRLVLELKDKVGAVPVLAGPAATGGTPVAGEDLAAEVRDALLALGYSAAEVTAALGAVADVEVADTATLLRAALRHLGGAGGR
ncbi:MAG: Holliday junction branch migration protein RuvA [Nitriliruptoraceae bacterium]